LGIRGKRQSISCVLPNAPQIEYDDLFSRVYFATDICNKQALDFMGLKNRRKTYPLCNERQKNRRRFGCLYRFVYCFGVLMSLKAAQIKVCCFEHWTKGFILSPHQKAVIKILS